MAYTALYRAYRPQDFKSVAGQKHIVKTLQNAIKLNKVAHAYLFSGPRGTGKTTMAKIMAKALNCEHGPSIEPCNDCELCRGITKGAISDVIEIDAASNNGVDEIRDLRDKVKYLPSQGKYKVYIIDEVHMLSQGAFNALLKTLEEPPHHVIFILATTEPHKVPATILSRCQRFDFQALSKEDITSRLNEVIASEKINVSPEAVDMISDYCEGGMRDALGLLDQSISYSTDDIVDANDVLAISGNVSAKEMLELLLSAWDSNGALVLEKINVIIRAGKEIPRIINDLIIFLRDILLFKVGKNNSLKSVYNTNEYQKFASEISSQLVYNWLDILNEALNNIKFTNQKRAYLELALLKMADKEINDYVDLVNRVSILEGKLVFSSSIESEPEADLEIKNKSSFESDPSKIQSFEEINQYPIDNDPVLIDDTYITVKDLEPILNSGVKAIKQELQIKLLSLPGINPNDFVINIIANGKIGAANETKAILVLDDIAKCNRIMKGTYYKKALNYLQTNSGIKIEEIYCVPESIWSEILTDFSNQYKANIKEPKLKNIPILVKKFKNEQTSLEDNNELESLFDENIFKYEEE